MSLNRNALEAFVKDNFMVEFVDQIFESSDLLKYLMSKSKKQGGRNIIASPLLYAKPTAHGGVTGYTDIDINPTSKWTAAEFAWRTLYSAITLSFEDTDAAEGDENAIASLVKKEMEVARTTMTDDIGDSLFNDGTDPLVPHGLQHIVDTDRQLGDIDSTGEPWWDANVMSDTTNYTAANLANPSSAYYIFKIARAAWHLAKHNSAHPDVIAISDGIEKILEEELQPYTRYGNDTNPANVDYDGFKYRNGKAKFLVDDLCPDGNMFFLNSKYVFPVIHRARNFKVGPFQQPVNKLEAIVSKISIKMNWVSTSPRMLTRIEGNVDIDA